MVLMQVRHYEMCADINQRPGLAIFIITFNVDGRSIREARHGFVQSPDMMDR